MSDKNSALWYRCRDFVEGQSAGEWDDKTITDDTNKLWEFVRREIRLALPPTALNTATEDRT